MSCTAFTVTAGRLTRSSWSATRNAPPFPSKWTATAGGSRPWLCPRQRLRQAKSSHRKYRGVELKRRCYRLGPCERQVQSPSSETLGAPPPEVSSAIMWRIITERCDSRDSGPTRVLAIEKGMANHESPPMRKPFLVASSPRFSTRIAVNANVTVVSILAGSSSSISSRHLVG
eukprot:1299760-Rhodomonas_salina.1